MKWNAEGANTMQEYEEMMKKHAEEKTIEEGA